MTEGRNTRTIREVVVLDIYIMHEHVWENKIPSCSPATRKSHESSFYYRRYRERVDFSVPDSRRSRNEIEGAR